MIYLDDGNDLNMSSSDDDLFSISPKSVFKKLHQEEELLEEYIAKHSQSGDLGTQLSNRGDQAML